MPNAYLFLILSQPLSCKWCGTWKTTGTSTLALFITPNEILLRSVTAVSYLVSTASWRFWKDALDGPPTSACDASTTQPIRMQPWQWFSEQQLIRHLPCNDLSYEGTLYIIEMSCDTLTSFNFPVVFSLWMKWKLDRNMRALWETLHNITFVFAWF